MKRLIVPLVLVLAFACLIFGQAKQRTPAAAKAPGAQQELMRLEREWAAAAVKADVAAIGRVLADDFVGTDPEGNVYDKAQVLAALKPGANKVASATVDAMRARVYGDVAVVTGRSIVKEVSGGKETSGQFRFTDTWVKHGGRWECVASHGTNIAKK